MTGKKFSIGHCLFLILFLFAADLFDLSGILISLGIVVFFLFYMKNTKLDSNALILMIFSVSYFLSVFYHEGVSFDGIIKYAICPWACYVLGYNLMRSESKVSVTMFSKVMFFGFFVHGFLNLIASVNHYGIDFNNPFRLAYDFWQQRQISVTTASLYYTPMVLMSIGILFSSSRKIEKLLSIFVIGIGLFATILYQNRTLILASGVVIAMSLIFLLNNRNVPKKIKSMVIASFSAIVVISIVVWITDIGGIRSLLESTSFFARLSGSNGEGQDRTKIWASFIFGDAWKYPLGGNKAVLYHNKTFVHNIWLDVYRRAGLVPFICLCSFTISSIRTVTRFENYSEYSESTEDYQTLALALIGVACAFFVEPVIEANPYIFYLPILVVGAMNGRIFDRGEWTEL